MIQGGHTVRDRYVKAVEAGRENVFYNSRTWRKKRLTILERDNYECQRCKKLGRVSKGDVAHHIKELRDHPSLGVVDDNLMTVCYRCHNIIHNRFEGKEAKKKIDIPERW